MQSNDTNCSLFRQLIGRVIKLRFIEINDAQMHLIFNNLSHFFIFLCKKKNKLHFCKCRFRLKLFNETCSFSYFQ